MKKNLIWLFAVAFSSTFCFSQEIDKGKLDNYLNTLETKNKFMGSITVSRGGELIYSKSIGFSDIENNVKANEKSNYRVGSVSKTFTSVLVLKAVEENKIQLNEYLNKYYPIIKNANTITIEHLLYHRSGIRNITDDDNYLEWNTQQKSEKELLEIIAKGGSEFEPNSKFTYSNSNYILLSLILQKLYNMPYAEILKEKITAPFGLKNTYYGSKIDSQKDECYSYIFSERWKKESEIDMSIPMGAGGIVSTSSDLDAFAQSLFSGKIISKNSLEQMLSLKDGFGMGIFNLPFNENEGFGHIGAIDGFSSMFTYFPESNVSFAMLSNGTNYSNNEIARAILSVIFNVPYDFPQFNTYQVTNEDLEKYLGTYTTNDLPLKLTISSKGKTLIAQATGQQPLSLESTDNDTFTFDRAGIVIIFYPEKKTLILKQGGGEFLFVKE